nr:uncharacterized protein si:ch211-13c6.2 isoform X2 [Scatophagus argus]
MKLDEPIIGLDYLDEVPSTDPQAGPKYTCRLCRQTRQLAEMVHHVIGRKHRQKYVELKRPDLVTWDKQPILTQGGKIIRARAEIIERQDGRGNPVLLPKKHIKGKLNISKVPPRQKQNRDRSISQRLTQRTSTSHLPSLLDFRVEYCPSKRFPPGHPNTPPFHSEEAYMLKRDRQIHQWEDTLSQDSREEELWRVDRRQSDVRRQVYTDPDYNREYEEKHIKDQQRRNVLEPGGVSRYDSRAEMLHGQARRQEYYPEEAPPYPETDPLKEFCSDEVRHGRVHSAEYQPLKQVYSEGDNHHWSLDRESDRRDSKNRAGRQGSTEPEAKRRNFTPPREESGQLRDHLFKVIDYGHKMRGPLQEELVTSSGPSRARPSNSERPVEATKFMSDIPEPFRRFLKGTANDEGHGKRKRKSRFSDATAEEVETTKEMFSDEYGPPNPKFGGCPKPVSTLMRPEIHGIQHPNVYSESEGPHHTENYQKGGSESLAVFDMLKNIEIENAEEADFLKNKLCDLLKEFKAKKSDQTGQNSLTRAVIFKDYNSLKSGSEPSPRYYYEKVLRDDSELRQPEDLYFQEMHRGTAWKQQEHVPDQRLQEYDHPVRGEPRRPNSNRSHYDEVLGWPKMSLTPRATQPDEPARFPESHTRDYRSAGEEFLHSHSSAPPLHGDRQPRMDRGPRYSSSLDKITSTLLELVARK